MKWLLSSACVFSVLLFTVYAAPASTGLQVSGGASVGGAGGIAGILSNIDLPGLLQGVNSFVKLVGVFCPPLSQVLDNVIQNVTSTAFRVFGRAILRSGGLGGRSGGSSSGGGGQRVNVVLPTFPPDEDYEDDEEDDSTNASTSENLEKEVEAVTDNASPTAEIDDSANTIQKRHIRVVREAEAEGAEEASPDQEGAESAPHPGQDLAEIDDQDRNKRYLPFGGGDDHGSAGGAGSGNFLFDIIRLVAGSGATEESDEHDAGAGGVAEVDIQKGADGYTEGIPGPITRLFVIANRGLANLVQDLILRLAQTSERLVNFKARLITALI